MFAFSSFGRFAPRETNSMKVVQSSRTFSYVAACAAPCEDVLLVAVAAVHKNLIFGGPTSVTFHRDVVLR